jgi:hypothetical protein
LTDRVLTAIDFDDEAFREADEIRHIGSDRSLSSEPVAGELMVAKCRPQLSFGIGLVAP